MLFSGDLWAPRTVVAAGRPCRAAPRSARALTVACELRASIELAEIAAKCFQNHTRFLCPPPPPRSRAEWWRLAWRSAAVRGAARRGPRPVPPPVLSVIAQRSSETKRGRKGHVFHASHPYFLLSAWSFCGAAKELALGLSRPEMIPEIWHLYIYLARRLSRAVKLEA